MLKVLSSAALSLGLLAGSANGVAPHTNVQAQPTSVTSGFDLEKPDLVSPTPALEEFAKKKGVDLSKHFNTAKNLPNGQKFNQPGDQHVTANPTDSDISMLVLLVKFADEKASDLVPAKYFNDLIFGDTYNPYDLPEFEKYDGPNVPKDRTMQNAYKESSYGKVTLSTDAPPTEYVTLPHDAEYYLGQDHEGEVDNVNGNAHMGELVADTIAAADSQVDFSKYANKDGEVPNVFIIHSGTGAEWSGDPAKIWSHSWDLMSALYYGDYYASGYKYTSADTNHDGVTTDEEFNAWVEANQSKWTKDGVTVGHYTIEPEVGGNLAGFDDSTGTYNEGLKSGPYPTQAGVFSHEFGHALGLPDLYDVDYTSEGDGNYSMMAGGSWTQYPAKGNAYSGNSPTEFDPFSKIFYGWAKPIDVKPEDGAQTITLPSIDKADPDNGIVKMEVPGSNGTEYYLFENAQQSGFNEGLGVEGPDAHGLLAWHVDENMLSMYQNGSNRVNSNESFGKKLYNIDRTTNTNHYGLSVVQQDGNFDLERNVNRGDAGDFFQTGDVLKSNGTGVYSGSFYFWKGYSAPGLSGINVKNIKENKDGSLTATFFYKNDKK